MLQALLIERFKLSVDRENREESGYALAVSKSGAKLKPAKQDEAVGASLNGYVRIFQGMPIAGLVNFLSGSARQPVIDNTGLIGRFDFAIDLTASENEEHETTENELSAGFGPRYDFNSPLGRHQTSIRRTRRVSSMGLTFNDDAAGNPIKSTKPRGMSGANAGTMVGCLSSKLRRTDNLGFQAFFFVIALLLMRQNSIAQSPPGKVDRNEVSASWLLFVPSGDVQTNSNRVQFGSDLGIDGTQSQVGFWFLIQPWQRSGLFAEFIPYRFDGNQTTTRSFRFGSVTYPVNQSVTANATLNYVSAGYLRDLINRPRIEGRLLAGVAYFGLRSRASSPSIGAAEVNRDVPFPLVGFLARYSPAEDSQWSLRGDIRGMTFGSYGRYIDVSGAFAFNLSKHISIEAGYRTVDGAGHHETRGADLNFRGPTITFRMHD